MISQSEQEWLKIGDDAANKVRHIIDRFKNRLAFNNLRLAERYINSELKILVCLSLVGRSGNIGEFIAEYENAGYLRERQCHSIDRNVPSFEKHNSSKHESMLVNNIELADMPERIIPSYVRLHSLDDFLRTGADFLYFSATHGRCVFLKTIRTTENREEGVFIGDATVSLDELPCKMVECTSQIMNGITKNDRDGSGNRLRPSDIKRCVLDYRVRLGSDCVRLGTNESLDSQVQISDVLFGPFNFEPDSIDSIHNLCEEGKKTRESLENKCS